MAARRRLFIRATSLGGHTVLIEHRASIEGPNTRTPQNLLRLSIGLEHTDDLIADLSRRCSTILLREELAACGSAEAVDDQQRNHEEPASRPCRAYQAEKSSSPPSEVSGPRRK